MKTKNIFKSLLIAVLWVPLFIFGQTEKSEKQIQEVTIKAGKIKHKSRKDNPAYAIMQEVWKRKKNNSLSQYATYQFKEYEKIEFTVANIDSTFMKKKMFRDLNFIFDYADSTYNGKLALPIFLNESIYKVIGENSPSKKFKKLLTAQKTSGFQDNQIVSLTAKNLYREINIYDNTINYFDIGFPSPVSSDGFNHYNYELTDTLNIKGQKAFEIRYAPKQSGAMAFQGVLLISKDQYAVLQAVLHSPKNMSVNFVNAIHTELEFHNPDEKTFLPQKVKTVIELSPFSKNRKNKSLVASRTVTYSDYTFNPALSSKDFANKEEELTADFVTKDDLFWNTARTDSLSHSEKNIYEMVDKLGKTPKFQRIIKTYETFASGYYNLGNAIDIGNLYNLYGYNGVEGHRIRIGARTYFSQNDHWRVQGYLAYGSKDKEVKYGAEGVYMFNRVNRFMVGIGTRKDIMQLGTQLTNDEGIMSRTFSSSAVFGRGKNSSLSHVQHSNVFVSMEPIKNFLLRIDGTISRFSSADQQNFNSSYYDKNGNVEHIVRDSHATLSIVARPGANFSKTGIERYEHSTLSPTWVIKYTHGFENIFHSGFKYNKIQIMFYKPLLLGPWGKSFFSVEAGKIFEPVPLAIQNVIPGNQSFAPVRNTFGQMNYYEFVADTYITSHWEHHFNGKLFSYVPLINQLKIREVVFVRGAYGTLSDSSKNINTEGYKYMAPDRNVYYEYGFGLENIGWRNMRFFRIDFNWRGNYLDKPEVSKFGIKFGLQFWY